MSICANGKFVDNYAETRYTTYDVSYIWKINDYLLVDTKGEEIKSSKFKSATNGNYQWYLILNPISEVLLSPQCVSIRLGLYAGDKTHEVIAKYRFVIMRGEKELITTAENSHNFSSKTAYTSASINLDRRRTLLDGYLLNDTLTIFCQIHFTTDLFSTTSNIPVMSNLLSFQNAKTDLSADFAKLYRTKLFSDVTILIGHTKFEAHRFVLAARSPVFEAMFRSKMKEKELNEITITDIEPQVFENFLFYLYTGQLLQGNNIQNIEVVKGLFSAADKYNVPILKNICEGVLAENLTVGNATSILKLADMHNAENLKQKSTQCLAEHLSNLKDVTLWKKVISKNPDLISKIYYQ